MFDPVRDPELKVSERPGSFAFFTLSNTVDTLKKYQGKYVCYASNNLGTAVSNVAVLKTDGKNELTNPNPNPPRLSMGILSHSVKLNVDLKPFASHRLM